MAAFRRTSSAASLKQDAADVLLGLVDRFPPNFIGGLIEAIDCFAPNERRRATFRRTSSAASLKRPAALGSSRSPRSFRRTSSAASLKQHVPRRGLHRLAHFPPNFI